MNVVPIGEQGVDAIPTFDDFWLLYPRRVARKDAVRAWARISEPDRIAAVVAIVEWRRVWLDDRFTPYPATWLNGERWNDELPCEYTQSAAAHKPASLPERPRGQMPEHVRAMLAKLRGKA